MFKLTDMKKNVLWMMAAILVCGLAAGALMACGDDNDEEKSQDKMEALCHVVVVHCFFHSVVVICSVASWPLASR